MIITYRPRMICTVLAIFFEILVLLFVILGAALNLFKPKGRFGAWWGANTCYTMWGIAYCSNHKRINAPGNAWKGFPCKATRDHINAAAAFTIFAIFLAAVTLVLTVLLLTSFGNKLYALIAAVVCCVSTLVAWTCVVGGYYFDCHNNYWGWNGGMSLSSNFHYGDAFGLLVAAWVLQIIQAILLYLSGWSYGIHHTTVVGTQKSAPASSQKSTTVVTTQRAAPASTQKSTFVVKTAPASTQKTTTTTVVGTQQKPAPVVTQKTTTTTVVTTTRK